MCLQRVFQEVLEEKWITLDDTVTLPSQRMSWETHINHSTLKDVSSSSVNSKWRCLALVLIKPVTFSGVYISAMYFIYQSICLQEQFIMPHQESIGKQPIIKKVTTNYTTNQGSHSKQQNLLFSQNFNMTFERLSQCLKNTFNVSLWKRWTKLMYYPTHLSILHKYHLQVLTHECHVHVYMLQCYFILVWSFTCNLHIVSVNFFLLIIG